MIDQFASEYGWDISKVFKHTFFQVKSLSKEIRQRRHGEQLISLRVTQQAVNGNRKSITSLVNSLKPKDKDEVQTFAQEKIDIPGLETRTV